MHPLKIYFPGHRFIPSTAISDANRPSTVPYFTTLPASLQGALNFCWEWLHGQEDFTQHTSGSTGSPQSIRLSREQMVASAQQTIAALQLTSQHTALVCLNTDYIGGKMMLVRSLVLGMDMVLVEPSSFPLNDLPLPPTFAALVPLQVQTILERAPTALHHFQGILVGGAPVSPALEGMIRKHVTSPIYATYGMTETVSHIALRSLNAHPPTDKYTVLGDTEIETDGRGCLVIRGAVTHHQTVVTNDLVDIVDARRFCWIGRYDFVINSGGAKVSPEKVEAALDPILKNMKIEGRFFVTGTPDERLGERVVLVVESNALTNDLKEELLAKLKKVMPPYKAPKEIYCLPQFIETSSGKIDRLRTKMLLSTTI